MTLLAPGANTGVNTETLNVTVSYSLVSCAELDVSAFLLTATGKVVAAQAKPADSRTESPRVMGVRRGAGMGKCIRIVWEEN